MRYLLILLISTTAACGHDSLYFGSYTRVGIDASATGAGVGVKNAALNIAPPKSDGQLYDVIGTTDMDLGYTYAVINEEIAVGDAANCAAQKQRSTHVDALSDGGKTSGAVVFGAYTSWALLDLSWGDATSKGIHFGYKRGVGVRVPVREDSVGAVYANTMLNTTNKAALGTPKSEFGGARYSQTFATGKAAIIKASGRSAQLNGGDNSYAGCMQ
jgi:hypothetical protein